MNTTITKSGLKAVISSKGAELISLQSSSREYIWEGNPKFWGKHSPVLFPIVGTLKNNSYTYEGQTYSLSRHGFARDREFELIFESESKAIYSLQSDNRSFLSYPFKFELQISYTVDGNTLSISYKVINEENFTMPFSIGAHPAFALPGDFQSYSLAFSDDQSLVSHELWDDLLSEKSNVIMLKNKSLPLTYPLFEKDALILKDLRSSTVTILKNDRELIRLHFDDFTNFGIWTKTGAPFICLEPWLGYSDSIAASGDILQKEGIQHLKGKSAFECQFSIEIL